MIRHIPKFLVIVAALLLVTPMVAVVQAATPTPQKLEEISRNCTSAQINLKQLQKRDAVSRINRGRAYDQMLRQVSALNSRFAYNKISAPQFVQIASDLQKGVDSFRALYSSYDEQLTKAINIDCKKQTIEFYEFIEKAREQRAALANDTANITKLNQDYRNELVKYQATLPASVSEEPN